MDEPGCIPGQRSQGSRRCSRPAITAILCALLCSNGMTAFVLHAINWQEGKEPSSDAWWAYASKVGARCKNRAVSLSRLAVSLIIACVLGPFLLAQSQPRTI